MLELFMSFSRRDLSGLSGCGKNQCLREGLRVSSALQQGPGSSEGGVTP